MHGARKRIKRVRAALRLSRDAIDQRIYVRENLQLRTIAAGLSGARDAHVLIETLAGLEARFAADLPPHATAELRVRLHAEHQRALEALAAEDIALTTSTALSEAAARTADWTFARDVRDYVDVHPHHFADAPTRDALIAVIDRRRRTLARRALKLGRDVYKRPPKRFVARIERCWHKRLQVS